jgi:hypothetical protein
MRYFWYFLTSAVVITVFIVLFFVFSLNVKNEIVFTDDDTITEPSVTVVDPSLGPSDAPVTLVNFGDYQCQGCADLEADLVALRVEYPLCGKICQTPPPTLKP